RHLAVHDRTVLDQCAERVTIGHGASLTERREPQLRPIRLLLAVTRGRWACLDSAAMTFHRSVGTLTTTPRRRSSSAPSTTCSTESHSGAGIEPLSMLARSWNSVCV